MAVEIFAVPGGVFSVWGAPTRQDIDQVIGALQAVSEQHGGPVLYVTRVPADAPPPDAETRRYLNGKIGQFAAHCTTYHVVLEGSGFGAAMKRGVLVTILQLVGRRGMFYVHPQASDVLDAVHPHELHTARVLLEAAQQQGGLGGVVDTVGRAA